ncbi:CpaF family protein [Thermomonospora cellulosilytica]|uniref:Flp pilus assembly CpaF family ATPase n=1 Tax=Thermomonospora cellulosilytica TaxID=1411118 RepID=A0A7W3MW94_9ACTN|nr:ATPase, T2SS/T4P/T4SS family [Thermomonospora cellulosilytica]MBA9003051.1 Flp pilus assembly CpaF family ATPase [Thermomonospora cellulosilytica]
MTGWAGIDAGQRMDGSSPQAHAPVDMWAAVREVGQRLVDVLGDDIDRDEARRLIAVQVRTWAHEQMAAGRPMLSVEDQRRVERAVFDHRFGLGPLQPYLERSDVENIVVNGCRQTWITYTNGVKEPGPPVAETDEDLVEWIQLLARRGNSGREFSHANPLLDVALADGVRLAVVHWVSRHPHLAIRVHRLVDVTLRQLTDIGTLSEPLAAFLGAAVRARRNVIVCGEVNTGKTTLVRALANEIPPEERIITLESDFELFLDDPRLAHRHHDVVALEARQANAEGAGLVRLQDLVPACLRLNPDRVIVGEARQGELAPMLEVMYSGARGSMCTLHVHRPEHVFNRVVQLGRRADLGLSPEDLHLMFGLAEPLVIYIQRDPATNERYVSEVMEVGPPGDSVEPTRNHIFVPGPDGRATPSGGHISSELLAELSACGFDPALLQADAGVAAGGWG